MDVWEKVIGTHMGLVAVLDYSSTTIRQWTNHQATVTDVSVDLSGEYVASCSSDGSVVVRGMWSDEQVRHEYSRPIMSVAIEPDYAKSEKREIAIGGKDEKLILITKGWFGLSTKDVVLGEKQGTIYTIRWKHNLIAWADANGVRVYDTTTKQVITFIDRPQGSVRPDLYSCQLVWENERTLIIGWANFVKITEVRERPRGDHASLPVRYLVITHQFRLQEFFVSGIAPFRSELAILGYTEPTASNPDPEPPALYIMNRKGEEISSDAIPLRDYAQWRASDFKLASLTPNLEHSKNLDAADWLAYIVSPKDVVNAQTRDLDDHLAWLISRNHHDRALEEIKQNPGRARRPEHTIARIGEMYLEHLLRNNDIDLAAAECPHILGKSKELWQQWIVKFERFRKLRTIASRVPTSDPTLDSVYYEMILNDFLQNDPDGLLATLNAWPSNLYRLVAIITGIKDKLKTTQSRSEQATLCKALTKLYIENKQFDEALDLCARLDMDVVDFIQTHGLQNFKHIGDQILIIVPPNPEKAIDLFVANTHLIRVDFVVQKLLSYVPPAAPPTAAPSNSSMTQLQQAQMNAASEAARRAEGRRLTWLYLHKLSEKNNRDEGNEFYDLQLQLYAEFDSEGFPNLKKFLAKSQAYNYNLALEICRSKGLFQEMAVLYDRIGNTQEALSLLIDKVGDVTQAIEFVTKKSEKGESELWDELITKSINKPAFVSELLERVGAHINPLKVIEQIPMGLAIPRLQKSLVKIINDYNLQMSLQEGCKTILDNDCVLLSERLTRGMRHAVRVNRGELGKCSMCSMTVFDTKVKAEIVIFFCGHVYHSQCLASRSALIDIRPDADPNARKLSSSIAGGGEGKDLSCKICRSSAPEDKSMSDKAFKQQRATRS